MRAGISRDGEFSFEINGSAINPFATLQANRGYEGDSPLCPGIIVYLDAHCPVTRF